MGEQQTSTTVGADGDMTTRSAQVDTFMARFEAIAHDVSGLEPKLGLPLPEFRDLVAEWRDDVLEAEDLIQPGEGDPELIEKIKRLQKRNKALRDALEIATAEREQLGERIDQLEGEVATLRTEQESRVAFMADLRWNLMTLATTISAEIGEG